MSEMEHIVVVDDEEDIRRTLEQYLGHHGFRVTVLDGAAALRALVGSGERFDMAILDITMPGEDGLSVARFLRETMEVGIIMVTASGETVDRIVGLEVGADDYVPKPVDLRELLARIRAVLRRRSTHEAETAAEPEDHSVIPFGHCRLDLDGRTLYDEDGKEIPLKSMEFDLLKAFAERPNCVLSRNQLLDLAHDRGCEPFDRSIDVRIARIRRKVEIDPGKPQVIKTVWGAGYVFAAGAH
ncbi:MAG: response regulator [Alphaproteobacteria bacterium]|nr:response regulator [Alphaproteobacteria bacterium]